MRIRLSKAKTYRFFGMILLFSLIIAVHLSANEINDKQRIKIVQTALNVNGFECGTADGIIGKKTKAAIEEYQKQHSMTISGVIDDDLILSLGLSEEMLNGVSPAEFIERYNQAVDYCNKISTVTGDPKIMKLTDSAFDSVPAALDQNTSISFLIDDLHISVRGILLTREENKYDVPMAYELVASAYAMDSSFDDVSKMIDFVGEYIEERSASTSRMEYSIWKNNDRIVFVIMPTV